MEDVISLNEAASITALAHTTLRKMCQRGEIQGAVKVARNWGIPRAWAEEHRAEDYTATHIPLPNAASLARITRQGLIDKIKSGEVKGFAQPLLERNRWWVERDAFEAWLGEREAKNERNLSSPPGDTARIRKRPPYEILGKHCAKCKAIYPGT